MTEGESGSTHAPGAQGHRIKEATPEQLTLPLRTRLPYAVGYVLCGCPECQERRERLNADLEDSIDIPEQSETKGGNGHYESGI